MVASARHTELEVCEGVESTWNYHLREKGSLKSLCGATVMQCRVPLSRWGKKIPNHHIPEKYCGTCDEKHEGKVLTQAQMEEIFSASGTPSTEEKNNDEG